MLAVVDVVDERMGFAVPAESPLFVLHSSA